jgi:hypothetical protein
MAKLWLTYAWKDNQDQDVDHVVEEKVGRQDFDRDAVRQVERFGWGNEP